MYNPNNKVKYRGKNINNHHLWYNRSWYQGKDKILRQLGGFVIPTTMYTHQLLHAQMRPPVKPFAGLRDDIIDYTKAISPDEIEDRFYVPNRVSDWLEGQAEAHTSHEYAYRASRLAEHLRKQIGYLALEDI